MTRAELADHLRQNVRERRQLSPELLAKLNEVDDDLIVDNYLNMTCEDCGKKLTEGLDAEKIIAESHSLDDLADHWATAKDHAHDHAFVFMLYEWPGEIDVEGAGDEPRKDTGGTAK